jgi:hypothetical protein
MCMNDVLDESKNTRVTVKNIYIQIAKIISRYIHRHAIALVRKLFNVPTYMAISLTNLVAYIQLRHRWPVKGIDENKSVSKPHNDANFHQLYKKYYEHQKIKSTR